jgi:dienelactone hydrolase
VSLSTRRFFGLLASTTVAVAALVLPIPVSDVVLGAALVTRAADLRGVWADRLVAWTSGPFDRHELQVPSRYGALRGRVYVPRRPARRTVLLTAGVHAEGIDEPRLVGLARNFAEIGVAVLTPELPDLLGYRITPRLPDMLEDAITWAAAQPRLAPDRRLGVVGISFSGGLSIVATGRDRVRNLVAYTVSFGGHGNLERTLRYLCTGVQPDGTRHPPHDYGVVIILLNAAHLLVPGGQVEPLRSGIRTFLRASHIDMVDHARARVVFDEAIAFESTLPEPARTLLHYVNTRDVKRLGPLLLPHVDDVTVHPSLSPERSPTPPSPVYLLHGTDDNVIPAIESRLLGESLRNRGVDVTVLTTPLITHAELDRHTDMADVWRLLRFWGSILGH